MASAKHNVTITYNSDIRGLKSAETELRRLERMIDEIEADPVNLAGNTPEQLNLLKKQLMELRVAMGRFKNGAQDAFRNYNADTDVANRQMKKLTAEHRKLTEELKAQARAQDVLNKKEDKRLSVLNRTRRALGQSFLEAPLYSASFALMAGIGAAIQQFVEFDKVLTRIGIVSERSAESMKTFKDMAIETGRALGTTGQKFAEASLIFIQQGGLAADNAAALAEASIKLANITGARAEDTSDYITAIANSFNMLETEGSRAGERIVDMLAELDAATGTSADEIANAFKKSASSFAVSGFSPEQSAAMLAVISETTRQAPELIGTGMKTLIGNLAEVRIGSKEFEGITNKLQDLTKQFGISFSLVDEYTGDVKDVKTLLNEVANIYNTVNSNAAKNALIEAIAGKEQRDRFIALVENWDRVAEVTKIAENSTGAAQKANERYLDSITAKVEQLKADFEALINEVLSSEVFKDLLDKTSAIVRNFTTLVEQGNAFYNILFKIAAILGPIALMKSAGGLVAGISGLAGAAGAVKSGGLRGALTGYFSEGMGSFKRPRNKDGSLKEETDEEKDTRLKKAGGFAGRVGGTALAGAFAIGNIASTVTNESLLLGEKTVGVIGSLLPVIGSLFGPVGTFVGMLAQMGLSFLFVNEEAAKVRASMAEMETKVNEAFESSGDRIKELVDVITSPTADKNSYAYIEASNKLAEILPEVSKGQDEYGNAILRDTEYLTKLVELKNTELEIEKQQQGLEIPKLMETAGKLQKQETKAGTAGGIRIAAGSRYGKTISQADILSGAYREMAEYKRLSEEGRIELEKQISALKENDLQAELYGLQLQKYGEQFLGFLVETDQLFKGKPEQLAAVNRGMQALLTGNQDITREIMGPGGYPILESAQERLAAILAMPADEQQAAYMQFYKDFAVEFANTGENLAKQDSFMNELADGYSLIFQNFIFATKERRLEIMKQYGFQDSDYDRVLDAALGQFDKFKEVFSDFNEEQKKLAIMGGDLKGIDNPLQTLFDSLAAVNAGAAANNIQGQIGAIVNTIQNSKKPLAQQYMELIEIQLEYYRLSSWLENAGKDYKLDSAEISGLKALNLKRLNVDVQQVTAYTPEAAAALFDKEDIVGSGGMMARGKAVKVTLNEGTVTAEGGGGKRDPIAEILGMYDTERAERQRAISEAEETLAGLTEGTKKYTEQMDYLIKLRSQDADIFVDENRRMQSELTKYQGDIDLTQEKIDKLQAAQKQDPYGKEGIFTEAMRDQLETYQKIIDAQKKLNDEITKLIDLTEKLKNLEAEQQSLESRVKLFKDGSKEQKQVINATAVNLRQQISTTKELKRSNTEIIKSLREQLKGNMTAEKRKNLQDELNEKLALDAQYTNAIFADEEAIYNLRKMSYDLDKENISTNIAKLESQLGNRLEQSAEYLKVQDMIIEQQKQLYNSNEKRLKDIANIIKVQALSENEKRLYLKEQNQLYIEQRNLMDQVNESIKKRAVDEYNIALYGTANMETLQSQYEMRQRLIDELIDTHEQLIERTQLELEIQKEIEESTDQTYKTNLKYLQGKIKDVKLTKQVIDSTRAQINLLKVLSGEQTSGPLRLTRVPSGQYRFAPTAGGEDGRQASMQAAAEFEKESISRYRELSDNIFNLEQQIPQMLLRGEDVTRAQALLGELRTQRTAQAEDVLKSKTISALVAEGKSNIASRLIAGRMTTAQAAQVLTARQREAISASAQGEFDAVLSSEQLLIQSNFSIVTSNYKLIDALAAFGAKIASGYATPEMTAIAANTPDFYEQKGVKPIEQTVTTAKVYGAGGKSSSYGADLFKKIDDDPAFRATEIARASTIINDYENAKKNRKLTASEEKILSDAKAYLARILGTSQTTSPSSSGGGSMPQTFIPNTQGSSNVITNIVDGVTKNFAGKSIKYETGGYTGDFPGGRMAMLHEKELVLNKLDTKNILDAVSIARSMPRIGGGFVPNITNASSNTGQNITINAEFPNVSSADEIKKAFSSMSTKALQYAYRTKSY